MGKPEGVIGHPGPKIDDQHPGYEIQDVNTSGIATFLAGLFGTVLVFFVFCFFMGKAINTLLIDQDGPANKWHPEQMAGASSAPRQEREDLTSNAVMQQKQLALMTQSFPTPRLQMDDGNQDTADLHAREDLLLNNYSSSGDQTGGAVRIPIDRAMELIVQRGLGTPAAAATANLMAGETAPNLQAPLTNGFARTGYELDTIEARHQKNDFERAEAKK